MDTVQFIEETLNIKLINYHKNIIKFLDKHPDYKVDFPKGQSFPSWYILYLCKQEFDKWSKQVKEKDR